MAKVLGLGGVFFKAKDIDKLNQWYKEYLGINVTDYGAMEFKPDSIPENGFSIVSFFKEDTKYLNPSKKDFMINFMVDDVAPLLERVKEGGAEVVDEVQDTEYGVFGWFIDPEGNKIELWKPV